MDINFFMKNEKEKPLDNIVKDGGFCSIFRKIICIGDSLSSGEFEVLHENGERSYHDKFEYSWGQFIARRIGAEVLNYSKGGMTAKEYCDTFAEKNNFWDENQKANAYIIALGVNDVNTDIEMGCIDDIDLNDYKNNKRTYIGYYAQIIQRYKKISPNAKFFFLTTPYLPDCKKDKYDEIAKSLDGLTKIFNGSYLIDLKKYGPDYTDKKFRDTFYLNNHMSPMGYKLTADLIMSYIDYIIRQNYEDFKMIAFE